MKLVASLVSLCFLYGASLAQGTSYHSSATVDSPPENTNTKKEQRLERGDLKGPRAKNHPTHAYRPSKAVVAAPTESSDKRMGPAAKNYKPWQDSTKSRHTTVTRKKKENLKGPRAKNRKPWDHR